MKLPAACKAMHSEAHIENVYDYYMITAYGFCETRILARRGVYVTCQTGCELLISVHSTLFGLCCSNDVKNWGTFN